MNLRPFLICLSIGVAIFVLVFVGSSIALGQEVSPLTPTGDSWFAIAYRHYEGIAGLLLIVIPVLTNILDPLLRKRYPETAQKIRLWGSFALRLFMSKDLKQALSNTAVVVTEALKPETPNLQIVESTRVTTTAIVPDDPKDKINVSIAVKGPSVDMPPEKSSVRLIMPFAGALALLCVGCAGLPPKMAEGVEKLSLGVSRADESARKLYTFALSLCQTDACQTELEGYAEPMIDGFQRVREAWCLIKPEAEGCDQ